MAVVDTSKCNKKHGSMAGNDLICRTRQTVQTPPPVRSSDSHCHRLKGKLKLASFVSHNLFVLLGGWANSDFQIFFSFRFLFFLSSLVYEENTIIQ